MRAYEFIQETAVINETPLPANQGKEVYKGNQVLSWHSLDEGLCLSDKISIFEEYHINGTLTESLDEDKTNYFMSLFKMSDEPKRGIKFIVAPLSLIGNRIISLDKPDIMEYLGKDNGQLVFKYKDKEIKYPSRTMRDLSLFHTFTFLNSDTYDKFRMALSLKFDIDLPEIKFNIEEEIINEVPLPPDWDKEVYRGKGTFKDRIRYAVERAKKIGTGSSRVAFIIEYEGRQTVLKIAKNKKGLAQNNIEADVLSDYYAQSLNIMIPIIDYDEENPEPLWIHTELAEKATEKKLCNIMKCEKLFYLTELVKGILGKKPNLLVLRGPVTAETVLKRIKQKTNMSDQDLNVLEEYASRIADLVANFDLSVGDISAPQNWGIYKGKPVLIDLGLTDTLWSTLYDKPKKQRGQNAGAGQGGGWTVPLKR